MVKYAICKNYFARDLSMCPWTVSWIYRGYYRGAISGYALN